MDWNAYDNKGQLTHFDFLNKRKLKNKPDTKLTLWLERSGRMTYKRHGFCREKQT